jgi:hypothetical protein
MGISLNGLTPAGTYPGLIKTGDNTAIDGTLKALSDGNGNNLPMEVSTTGVNFTNQLQQGGVAVPTASQVAAKQDTLVSGTNIKTINSTSILGSGNINVVTSPSGVAGAIQFSNGSAFASDASNLFWDDTNNRLGVGTNAPSAVVHAIGASDTNSSIIFRGQNLSGADRFRVYADGYFLLQQANNRAIEINPGGYINFSNYSIGIAMDTKLSVGPSAAATATMNIKGSGSTSATTSLLVQNSAGSAAMTIKDDLSATFNRLIINKDSFPTFQIVNATTTWQHYLQSSDYKLGTTSADYINISGATGHFNALTSMGVGATSPNASARFQVDSTTQGVLFPRMTTTQKNAIATPAAGLVVYDNTTNKLCCYNGSTWNDLF